MLGQVDSRLVCLQQSKMMNVFLSMLRMNSVPCLHTCSTWSGDSLVWSHVHTKSRMFCVHQTYGNLTERSNWSCHTVIKYTFVTTGAQYEIIAQSPSKGRALKRPGRYIQFYYMHQLGQTELAHSAVGQSEKQLVSAPQAKPFLVCICTNSVITDRT